MNFLLKKIISEKKIKNLGSGNVQRISFRMIAIDSKLQFAV